jgi:hypothetical protein
MEPTLWQFRDPAIAELDLSGYAVEAVDGLLGSVTGVGGAPRATYLHVEAGVWILGRQLLLPAGLVSEVDPSRRIVRVSSTREQAHGAPQPQAEGELDAGERGVLEEWYRGQVPPSASLGDG